MAVYDGEIRIKTKIDEKGFNEGMGNLSASAAKLGKTLIAAFAVKQIYEFGKALSTLSISLEASMMRVYDIFGQSANAIDYFANRVAFSLGISRKAAYEYASVYGNLFMSIARDSKENADLTLKYLQASAVIASKSGRTIQDVMERIRSGILGNTEAIEDLGIEVRVAMLEMTDIFKTIADGRSWEQLSYYEQQQIRILGILEQANKKFGASVAVNSILVRSQFTAAMENLKVSVGNVLNVAIIPMIQALTQFVVLLEAIFIKIFGKGAEVQNSLAKSSKNAAAGQSKLADNTKKAGKAAENALASFDELNVLQQEMATGATDIGGGISGFGDLGQAAPIQMPMLDIELPPGLQKIIDKFIELKESVGKLGEKFDYLWNQTGMKESFELWGSAFAKVAINTLIGLFTIFGGAIDIVSGALKINNSLWKGDFTGAIEGAVKMLQGLGEVIYGILIVLLGKEAADSVVEFTKSWSEKISVWWNEHVVPWFSVDKWIALWTVVKSGWESGWASINEWWVTSGMSIWWDKEVMPYADKWDAWWKQTKKEFSDGWKTVTEWWNNSGINVWWEKDVKPWFTTKKWEELLLNVQTAFSNVFTNIKNVVGEIFKGMINKMIDGVNFLIQQLNKIHFEVPEWVPGMGGKSWGINIPEIPHLAKGAVIEPNQPFLAMLGDQPSGINIETPLETMLEAFKGALAEMGGNSGGGDVVLMLDGKQFARAIIPSMDQAKKQRGTNLVVGAV